MLYPTRNLLLCLLLLCISGVAEAQVDVSTGPAPLQQSAVPSSYMRGAADRVGSPKSMRILGTRLSTAGIIVEAVLLDENGNFLGPMSELGAWTARLGCKTDPLAPVAIPIVDQTTWQSSTPSKRIEVLVDNSITSKNLTVDVLRGLRNILPGIAGTDSIGVATFDQTTLEVTPLTTPSAAAQSCAEFLPGNPAGIPAVYSAMMSALRVFDSKEAINNILVVVTASNDLATLSYSTADVVAKAKARGVRVFVVKVGSSAYGYVYRYVTAATGGRVYTIDQTQAELVADIIREILYSSKQHVEAFIPFTASSYNCNDVLVHVGYTPEGASALADTILVPLKDRAFRTTTATVAVFEDTTERGLQEFYPILAVLAEDMMSDSSKRIRLTGHVSPDLTGDAMARGQERAENVAAYLKAYGVKSKQIDVQSAGNSKPLYYLQLDGTQRLLNNRVEATFLLPDNLPYTIAVERVVSEELAASKVEAWEAKGYKAYFEPAVSGRKPVYDIILWGYRTKDDAQNAGKGLAKHGVRDYVIR